jgi:YVTN family beta-propeller protein
VIDIASRKVVNTIAVGEYPEGINYDAASDRIFVANWFDDTVSVIDASNNQLIASVKTGSKSRAFGQFILETAH